MKNKILFAILPVLLVVGLANAETYISDCQQLGADNETYILTQDIIGTNATTCFDIVGQNITLDCHYHKIISDGTGNTAISLGNDHITVQNCYVDNFTGFSINMGGNYARLINVSVGAGLFSIALGDNAYLKNITSLGGYTDTFIHAVTGRSNVTIDGVYGVAEPDVSWFIFVPNSYNVTIKNVNVYAATTGSQVSGIGVENSDLVTIHDVYMENVTQMIDVHSSNDTVVYNVEASLDTGVAISAYNSINATFYNLNLSGFDPSCVSIDGGDSIEVYNSNISNCLYGIYLDNTDNSIIHANRIENNGFGIVVENSHDNTIYDNYFYGNDHHVQITDSSTNYWNTTKQSASNILGNPYIGGNYWSGFSEYCGDSDSDGICDSTYTIDENNIDYLPLAKTVGQAQTMPTYHISGCQSITSQGYYILDADLDSGNAECIRIESNDVVLDLNGYAISNDGVSSPVIFLTSGGNITVENGTIIGGVNVENVNNVLFKDLYIDLRDFSFYIDHEEIRHNITLDAVTIVTDWDTYGGHLWFRNVDGLHINNSYIDRIESCGSASNVYIENTVVNFRNITDVQGGALDIGGGCGGYSNLNINNVIVYQDESNHAVWLEGINNGSVNNLKIYMKTYHRALNLYNSNNIDINNLYIDSVNGDQYDYGIHMNFNDYVTIDGATILHADHTILSEGSSEDKSEGITFKNIYVRVKDNMTYAENVYDLDGYTCKQYYADDYWNEHAFVFIDNRYVYLHNVTVENVPNTRVFSISSGTTDVLIEEFAVRNGYLVVWSDRTESESSVNQNITIRNGYIENASNLGISRGDNGWTVENIVFNNSCFGVYMRLEDEDISNIVVRNITMHEGLTPVFIHIEGANGHDIDISNVAGHHSYRLFRISGINGNVSGVSFSNGECYQCDHGIYFYGYGNASISDVNISNVHLELNTSANNYAVWYRGEETNNIIQNVHMWDNTLATASTLHHYELVDAASELALIDVARFDSDSPEHYYQLSADPQNYTAKIQAGSSVSFNVDAYLDTNLLNVTYYINATDISGAENISKDSIHVVVNGNEYSLSQPVAVNVFEFDNLHNNQIPITVKLPVLNKVGVYEGKIGIKINPYAEVSYSIEVIESFVQKSVSLMFAAAGFMSVASIIIMIMNSRMSSLKDIMNMVLYIILISSVVGILFSII